MLPCRGVSCSSKRVLLLCLRARQRRIMAYNQYAPCLYFVHGCAVWSSFQVEYGRRSLCTARPFVCAAAALGVSTSRAPRPTATHKPRFRCQGSAELSLRASIEQTWTNHLWWKKSNRSSCIRVIIEIYYIKILRTYQTLQTEANVDN